MLEERKEMKIVAFGEIMGRICMPSALKFIQALPGPADITFAGAEANVAASVSLFGAEAVFVTALPRNELSSALIMTLHRLGINTEHILLRDEGRLGLYFVEPGANQRPSRVIYDRGWSTVSMTPGDMYDWKNALKDADWFHISGITPALSETSLEASVIGARMAKECGVKVSVDLNFRSKLWKYGNGLSPKELCRKSMARILPYADLVIGNEGDADDVMGIKAGESDVAGGKLDIGRYPEVAAKIVGLYPNVSRVAITLRESISATHNNWGAMLYTAEDGRYFFAPVRNGDYHPYEIRNIIDRIGGGDSFSAALVYALSDPDLSADPQDSIAFAAAASCLCHSIYGDFNYTTKEEVLALMKGDASGRVKR